jgi:acyl-CoA synthetase (AMP-forming)/AMP-acid ligase II
VADDVLLCVLPLSFGYGLSQIYTAFHVGATVVLEKSFAFPFATLQKMAQEKVTGFALVPTIAALLLQARDLPDVPSLRYLTNAAAALPTDHVRRLRERFPQAKLFSMYGMTECTRATYLPPEQLDVRPHSVGRAIPGTEALVVDEEGYEVPPGRIGELVVRGPHVMQGYWNDPVTTAAKLRRCPRTGQTVLHSGDLFQRDKEGYLYFVSRQDDVIKTRGEKVAPKEVENVLYLLPGVREAVVYGVPDPVLGQAVVAALVPVEEGCLTERQVLAHCRAHLEDVLVPKRIEFREALPHTDNGKIKRRDVQAESLASSSP